MIFANRIYKISSGKNISLYAEDKNRVSMFIFKDLTEKKYIDFSSTIKCSNLPEKYGYKKVIKINDLHNLICLDKNFSIVEDF